MRKTARYCQRPVTITGCIRFQKDTGDYMTKKVEVPNIHEALAKIAGEMCDQYCKWPDKITKGEDEDAELMELVEEHCLHCPMMQFFNGD